MRNYATGYEYANSAEIEKDGLRCLWNLSIVVVYFIHDPWKPEQQRPASQGRPRSHVTSFLQQYLVQKYYIATGPSHSQSAEALTLLPQDLRGQECTPEAPYIVVLPYLVMLRGFDLLHPLMLLPETGVNVV